MTILKSLTETRDLEIKQRLFTLTESFPVLHRQGRSNELCAAVGAVRILAQSNSANGFLKPYCETALRHVKRYETAYSITI